MARSANVKRDSEPNSSLQASESVEVEPARRRTRPRSRRVVRPIAVFVVFALLAMVGVGLSLYHEIEGSKGGRVVNFVVKSGNSLSGIAPQLQNKAVVSNLDVFKLWLKLQSPATLQPGSYRFREHESYAAILAQIRLGPTLVKLTIPPGFTISQVAVEVHRVFPQNSEAGFLKMATDGAVRSIYEPASVNSLEGLIYPDTYLFSPAASNGQVIKAMVAHFEHMAARLKLTQKSKSLNLSPYQVITVASMVEREAKLATDRGKVARVIYNRLAIGMPLQIDATVLYGLGNPPRSLSNADLQAPSAYNTYLNQGLPPTPIAAPGRAALLAALTPTPGPWLYYVVVSANGAEAFSSTLGGQNRNIALANSRGLN